MIMEEITISWSSLYAKITYLLFTTADVNNKT